MLLGNAIVFQTQQVTFYKQFDLESDENAIPDETILKLEVVILYLFYFCLWSIKLSFLIFFWRLGSKVLSGLEIWWMIVLGINIATFASCIGEIEYHCLFGNAEYIDGKHGIMLFRIIFSPATAPATAPANSCKVHCSTAFALKFKRATLYYNCTADIVTNIPSKPLLAHCF